MAEKSMVYCLLSVSRRSYLATKR